MKILLVLAALVAIVWIMRTLSRSRQQHVENADNKGQRMLACAHCGLHVPEEEAILDGKHAYCCDQHRDSGPK